MKATILFTTGERTQTPFHNFGSLKAEVFGSEKAEVEFLSLGDEYLCILAGSKNGKATENALATDMACIADVIYPSEYISGDAILIDNKVYQLLFE